MESLLTGFLMNASGCHILEESLNVSIVDVWGIVLVGGTAVSTRTTPAVLRWRLRNEAGAQTVYWILG